MGGCRAGLRERRFVGRASPPPLPPLTPPLPLLPLYLRSGVPSAFAGGIGGQSQWRRGVRDPKVHQDSAIYLWGEVHQDSEISGGTNKDWTLSAEPAEP